MFSENGEGTRWEEMHGKGSQEITPADGTEVGDNQEKQKQEELEKQKQEELEKLEAQKKQQEQRDNDARIEAQKIAKSTEAPASNPNSDEAIAVKSNLDGALRETFP